MSDNKQATQAAKTAAEQRSTPATKHKAPIRWSEAPDPSLTLPPYHQKVYAIPTFEPEQYEPHFPEMSFLEFSLRILFFPLVLIWHLLKLAFTSLFGSVVGEFVTGKQESRRDSEHPPSYYYDQFNRNYCGDGDIQYGKTRVRNPDGSVVHGIEICRVDTVTSNNVGPDEFPVSSTKPYVINVYGRGASFVAHFDEMVRLARDMDAHVISFDCRGIGINNVKHQMRDWFDPISDVIAQVKRLIKRGVPPNNIFLNGHSLGGAYSIHAKRWLERNNINVSVFAQRTFRSSSDVFVGMVRSRFLGDESWFTHMMSYVAMPFAEVFFRLTGWQMDAADTFMACEPSEKFMMAVIAPEVVDSAHGDPIIPDYTSLYTGVRGLFKSIQHKIKNEADDVPPGMAPAPLHYQKAIYKQPHINKPFFDPHGQSYTSHSCPLDQLQDRYGNDGLQLLYDIIRFKMGREITSKFDSRAMVDYSGMPQPGFKQHRDGSWTQYLKGGIMRLFLSSKDAGKKGVRVPSSLESGIVSDPEQPALVKAEREQLESSFVLLPVMKEGQPSVTSAEPLTENSGERLSKSLTKAAESKMQLSSGALTQIPTESLVKAAMKPLTILSSEAATTSFADHSAEDTETSQLELKTQPDGIQVR